VFLKLYHRKCIKQLIILILYFKIFCMNINILLSIYGIVRLDMLI